ncbi:MAG: hypothetical protein H6Q33_1430 [Deltaproteobacteria bacterium]|nr:hypothetical protein [Deltaproteobacteria bacterium]
MSGPGVFALTGLVPAVRAPAWHASDAGVLRVHHDGFVLDTPVDTLSEPHLPDWKFDARNVPFSAEHPDGSSVDLRHMREGGLDDALLSVYIAGTVTGPRAGSSTRSMRS